MHISFSTHMCTQGEIIQAPIYNYIHSLRESFSAIPKDRRSRLQCNNNAHLKSERWEIQFDRKWKWKLEAEKLSLFSMRGPPVFIFSRRWFIYNRWLFSHAPAWFSRPQALYRAAPVQYAPAPAAPIQYAPAPAAPVQYAPAPAAPSAIQDYQRQALAAQRTVQARPQPAQQAAVRRPAAPQQPAEEDYDVSRKFTSSSERKWSQSSKFLILIKICTWP